MIDEFPGVKKRGALVHDAQHLILIGCDSEAQTTLFVPPPWLSGTSTVLSGTNVWFTHTISFSVQKQCFSHRDRRGVHLFLGDVAEMGTRSLSGRAGRTTPTISECLAKLM